MVLNESAFAIMFKILIVKVSYIIQYVSSETTQMLPIPSEIDYSFQNVFSIHATCCPLIFFFSLLHLSHDWDGVMLFDETSPIMLYVVRKSTKWKVCYTPMLFVKVRKERSSAGSKVGNSNPHGEFGNHDEKIQSSRSAQSGDVQLIGVKSWLSNQLRHQGPTGLLG